MLVIVLILILIAILYSSERGRDLLYTLYLVVLLPFILVIRIFSKKQKPSVNVLLKLEERYKLIFHNENKENRKSKLRAIAEFNLKTTQNSTEEHIDNYKIFSINSPISHNDLLTLFEKNMVTRNKKWTDVNLKGFLDEGPEILKKDSTKYLIYKIDKNEKESINSISFNQKTSIWEENIENSKVFDTNIYVISKGEQQMELN